MNADFLAQMIGETGPIHNMVLIIALVLMAIAAGILIMEILGYTITNKGIVKHNFKWNARAVAIAAICAAVYIALVPFSIAWIPGIGGFTPARALPAIFGAIFGLPGMIGTTFSMPIGDAISGKLTLGSIAGFLAQVYVTWIPYKLVKDPSMRNFKSIATFFLWGIFIAPLIISIMVPGWLDFMNVIPAAVAWGGVWPAFIISYMISPIVISPLLLLVIYPLVRKLGLFHRDI